MMSSSVNLFKFIFNFLNFFQEHYQGVKRFGSRSGLAFCRVWSGGKLYAKTISRRQKWPLAGKGFYIGCLESGVANKNKQKTESHVNSLLLSTITGLMKYTLMEPVHEISNNVAFWHVQTRTSLCSLLLSLETPNGVQAVA